MKQRIVERVANLSNLRPVKTIRIHCPITPETFRGLAQGRLEAIEADPVAAPILALIRADNVLGDFGLYRGVFEIVLGLEGFTPTAEADPTLGAAGINALSATAVIKTYVVDSVPADQLGALLDALAALHPWQIPVIEVAEAALHS